MWKIVIPCLVNCHNLTIRYSTGEDKQDIKRSGGEEDLRFSC